MSIEAPNRAEQELTKQSLAKQDLEIKLAEFGYEPIKGYKAIFYMEEDTQGNIIDHMIVTSDLNPNYSTGIFKLKREKLKTLDEHLRELTDSGDIQKNISVSGEFKKLETEPVIEVMNRLASKNLKQENLIASFNKWHDGRIHTFFINENGNVVGVSKLDPQRGLSASDYFKGWEPDTGAFEKNKEEYGDENHP